ncbi:MAG: hypothetical protein EOO14_13330 [Chitinophagaceae bacterium]|nr:MAG: hypothetical protein EOO14_13330 [Chitinophagaceae bacterium]
MKTFLLSLLLLPLIGFGQTQKEAVFYCIDHPAKTLYYSQGKAVVKKGLDQKDFYLYGFLKWKGWINRSWASLDYDLRFVPTAAGKRIHPSLDSLLASYRVAGYTLKNVPMPYPMKPFAGYKKDGTN